MYFIIIHPILLKTYIYRLGDIFIILTRSPSTLLLGYLSTPESTIHRVGTKLIPAGEPVAWESPTTNTEKTINTILSTQG